MKTQTESKLVLKLLIALTTLTPTFAHADTGEVILHFLQKWGTPQIQQNGDTESFTSIRRNHAKELLGKFYQSSVVRKQGDKIKSLSEYIFQSTQRELRSKWKGQARTIASAILTESKKYGFDPIFLMAVIENESSFNVEAVGSVGEIGLMQITPQTAQWISKKYDIPFRGAKTLKDPVANIALGSAYLSYLREKFDFKSNLYLAAYNMGTTKLIRNLAMQRVPLQYPSRVMQRYVRFYSQANAAHHVAMN